MRLLLDTHVWIWSQEAPEKLGPRSTEKLSDSKSALFVSAVSTLEIARLVEAGVIELEGTVESWVAESLDALYCGTVEVSHEIAAGAYALPAGFHRDPADRILAATARHQRLTLLTADERILAYPHLSTEDARR